MEFMDVFAVCPLFQGMDETEIQSMVQCLGGKRMDIAKGDPVFLEGDPAEFVGVVLSGAVQIVRDDYLGDRSVMAVAEKGDLFAEAFSCAGENTLPVSAFALQDSRVILFDCKKVLTVCSHACPFHQHLVQNLLQILARKNLSLSRKIQVMSKKTTREKLMAYLMDQAGQKRAWEFVIPHDRQGLADYLSVERSAMSAEISKMKKEGLIDTKGSWFHLLRQ